MSVKVRIRNFQSIRDATIEIDGLTVISGQNNIGKTAIMRAIKGVFTNTPGHNFVRHGAEKCIVELTFDDGNYVKWEKGEKIKPKYTVNGKEILPGKGVPDEVRALGVVPIEAAGREVWPQIAEQFTGTVFLLDQPGSVLAEAIADVERVGHLNRAMRESDRDKRNATNKLKVRREDVEICEQELEQFEDLDDLVLQMSEIDAQSKNVERIEKGLQGVKDIRAKLMAAQALVDSLAPVENIKLPSTKEIKSVVDLHSSLDAARELGRRHQNALRMVRATKDVEKVKVPTREEIGDVERISEELSVLRDWSERYKSVQASVRRFAGIKKVTGIVDDALVKQAQKQEKALGIVSRMQDGRQAALRDLEYNEKALEKANKALAVANHEVEGILVLLPVCPTCSRPMRENHGHTSVED